jgi:predicted membrane protein
MAATDERMSEKPSSSGPVDPIRVRRAQVARWALLANRVGYLLFGLAVALFVVAFLVGFTGALVTAIVTAMVVGSILLAPSIVLGYAVKAAEKEDRARGV